MGRVRRRRCCPRGRRPRPLRRPRCAPRRAGRPGAGTAHPRAGHRGGAARRAPARDRRGPRARSRRARADELLGPFLALPAGRAVLLRAADGAPSCVRPHRGPGGCATRTPRGVRRERRLQPSPRARCACRLHAARPRIRPVARRVGARRRPRRPARREHGGHGGGGGVRDTLVRDPLRLPRGDRGAHATAVLRGAVGGGLPDRGRHRPRDPRRAARRALRERSHRDARVAWRLRTRARREPAHAPGQGGHQRVSGTRRAHRGLRRLRGAARHARGRVREPAPRRRTARLHRLHRAHAPHPGRGDRGQGHRSRHRGSSFPFHDAARARRPRHQRRRAPGTRTGDLDGRSRSGTLRGHRDSRHAPRPAPSRPRRRGHAAAAGLHLDAEGRHRTRHADLPGKVPG